MCRDPFRTVLNLSVRSFRPKSFVPPAGGARVGGPRAHPLLGIWADLGEMVHVQGEGGRGLLYEPGQNPWSRQKSQVRNLYVSVHSVTMWTYTFCHNIGTNGVCRFSRPLAFVGNWLVPPIMRCSRLDMAVGGHPSHPLGLHLVQLDLPREEGPTAEAARLTDIREPRGCAPCMGAGGCQRAWANSV